MNFGGMFRKSLTSGAGGSSSHPDSRKKPWREREGPEADFNKEYKRLSERKVLPTKWVDYEFLSRKGLSSDFTSLVSNASLEVFSSFNCDTYKCATLEFLATFHDDLAVLGRDTTVSFQLNNTPHVLTFEEFCGCFGFSTGGGLEITEEVVQEAQESWQHISVHGKLNYPRKKTSSSRTLPFATSPSSWRTPSSAREIPGPCLAPRCASSEAHSTPTWRT
jgi:hypothetical protein